MPSAGIIFICDGKIAVFPEENGISMKFIKTCELASLTPERRQFKIKKQGFAAADESPSNTVPVTYGYQII